jgi:hypothetical protein
VQFAPLRIVPPLRLAKRSRGLTGTPIAGALLKADNGSWGAVVGFSGGTILLGTILAFIARMYLSKWKLLAAV